MFFLSSMLLSFPFFPWGEDASHAIWFRAECRIQTHLTSDNVNSWRLMPVYLQPARLAINKSRRVRGRDETLNPVGVVDVLVFFFFRAEQSKDPGGFSKCSKAFVSVLWYVSLSTEVTPTAGPELEDAQKKAVLQGIQLYYFNLISLRYWIFDSYLKQQEKKSSFHWTWENSYINPFFFHLSITVYNIGTPLLVRFLAVLHCLWLNRPSFRLAAKLL